MTLRVMNTRPVQKGRNMYRYHNDNAAVSNYQYNVWKGNCLANSLVLLS